MGEVGVFQSQDAPSVRHHMGVRRRRPEVPAGASSVFGDTAIAVPLRFAVNEADAVQHPLAQEPVRDWGLIGVGAVADEQTVEIFRDCAVRREVVAVYLFGDRGVVAPQPPRAMFCAWG